MKNLLLRAMLSEAYCCYFYPLCDNKIAGELYPGKWFESNGALRRHNVMKQIREGYKLIEREK